MCRCHSVLHPLKGCRQRSGGYTQIYTPLMQGVCCRKSAVMGLSSWRWSCLCLLLVNDSACTFQSIVYLTCYCGEAFCVCCWYALMLRSTSVFLLDPDAMESTVWESLLRKIKKGSIPYGCRLYAGFVLRCSSTIYLTWTVHLLTHSSFSNLVASAGFMTFNNMYRTSCYSQ